jgi:putative hemolysin
MNLRQAPYSLTSIISYLMPSAKPRDHVVDQLIAERATHLSRNPAWPALRPLIYRYFDYDLAVSMANDMAPLSGIEAFDYLSKLLALDVTVTGLGNIPKSGGFVLAPSHPTGIADGIAVYELMKPVRNDLSIFANRDALRVSAGLRDLIIPVEWRQGEKSHSKSRDTLEMTAKAFANDRAVVLFPSGRIAYWTQNKLTERPWQPSFVALARRYNVPVVPAHITARNSGLFYFLSNDRVPRTPQQEEPAVRDHRRQADRAGPFARRRGRGRGAFAEAHGRGSGARSGCGISTVDAKNPAPSGVFHRRKSRNRQPIFWPVLAQSARKASRPLSVSGCLTSALSVAGGTVATSAPIMAASLTWFTVRIEAARISVLKS